MTMEGQFFQTATPNYHWPSAIKGMYQFSEETAECMLILSLQLHQPAPTASS